MKNMKSKPEGYNSITPNLVMQNAAEAIEYYKKAFGAELTFRQDWPNGKIMHAAIKIGDSNIMLSDQCESHEEHEKKCVKSPEELNGTTVNLYLYVDDVDEVFQRAIEEGGKEVMEVTDMFWGDRTGMLIDPFGHYWTVATQKERVNKEEMKKRVEKFMAESSCR
jgi:PhnB protein